MLSHAWMTLPASTPGASTASTAAGWRSLAACTVRCRVSRPIAAAGAPPLPPPAGDRSAPRQLRSARCSLAVIPATPAVRASSQRAWGAAPGSYAISLSSPNWGMTCVRQSSSWCCPICLARPSAFIVVDVLFKLKFVFNWRPN
jgi:hypothetical protein